MPKDKGKAAVGTKKSRLTRASSNKQSGQAKGGTISPTKDATDKNKNT